MTRCKKTRIIDRLWTPGDELGPGAPYDRDYHFKVGSGTLDDPYVYWGCNLNRSQAFFDANIAIARQEAIAMAFECVVVRRENHDWVPVRDKIGRKQWNSQTNEWVTEPCDSHLTLELGTDLNNIQLQGHRFVNCDEDDLPVSGMTADDRMVVADGHKREGFEYWGKGGSCGYDKTKFLHKDDIQRRDEIEEREVPSPAAQARFWRRESTIGTVDQIPQPFSESLRLSRSRPLASGGSRAYEDYGHY